MLDRFYLIVDSAAWIARLLPCGVRLAQLRIKNQPDATIRAEIKEANALCERHGAKLVVNDHWQQAMDAGCDFIHLGQGDLATADLAAIRRAGVRFGVSTHDEAELSRALDVSPDYIALGPIYPTILKAMAFAPQGLPRIAEWKKKIGKTSLVGIGGITLDRVAEVLQAGADSAAVVSDIARNADPEQRARDWVKATRRFT
ncbi:MAG: thiamine phosphate synthase [Beijerinckiaceae bacterium]|nr:MAG: thiamine phosphate synthase [Beijerinckiaceae bacterium]